MTAATNRAETFNGYSKWLAFGNNGVIAENDPEQQEKIIKFNELEANCLIYSTALDLTEAVRVLKAHGQEVDNAVPAAPDPSIDLGLPPPAPRWPRADAPAASPGPRQMALFSQADPYAQPEPS